jgi:hypothetical protein
MADPLWLWHHGFVTIGKGKRPRDTNQLAKFIVDVTTGELPAPDPNAGKNRVLVAMGREGGKKGGKARAEKLSPAKRKAIAKKAAQSRWHRS